MKKISLSIIAFSLLMVVGCKKSFLDINRDPNRATETSVTPDLAMAAQMANIAGQNASSWDMFHRWMGYWSASGSYSRATVEMSYNITNTTMEPTWNNIYYILGQLKSIQTKSTDLDYKFYQGMSKILSAYQWSILVDLYGNVPFEEALNFTDHIRPTYTSGADIYKALLPMIDEGISLIKSAEAGKDPNIATQDIIFKGNKTNWAKFGNTLKLRLLLHAYKTNIFNVQSEISKITAEGSGFLGNGISAAAQPGYTPDKPNPYYNAHFWNITGTTENDRYNRANCFSLDMMKSLNDPRYKKVYREAKALPGQWRCTDYGQNPDDDVNSDRTSGVGYGITADASVPMWIMDRVEAAFLVAEATARGWLTGDAQAAYTAAVRESFRRLGLTNADADTYLTSINPKIAWPASGTTADKVAVVIWQKYFALNGIQSNETWTDWRRTNVVNVPLSLAPERGSNQIPRRLLYPLGEFSYNADNVPQGVTQWSKIFWDL